MTRFGPVGRGGASALSARERDPRRRLGAFYTPGSTARLMADWVLRSPGDRILEPSFGDGSFLSALAGAARHRGWPEPEVAAVEIDRRPFDEAVSEGLVRRGNALRADFLDVDPFPVDAAVGNPPYVRLRHLTPAQRTRALRLTEDSLGHTMESSGSVWMPFVLHATRFLRPGGRLAFVLPYELTYVRYARPLWDYLGRTFGRLRVLRARDRLFPDILQEAVVLLADAKGRTTGSVELSAYDTVGDLADDVPAAEGTIALERVVAGERAFLEALLPRPLQDLLAGKARALTDPAAERVRFRIGYVCADKDFFHPDPATVERHRIPAASLLPAVTSTRRLVGAGLLTSALTADRHERLFLPHGPHDLSPGEEEYVAAGVARGVDRRYKCRIRDPWFVVPLVKIPDLVFSVFCELPLLMLNDGGFAASNSLLCGYMPPGRGARAFAASWYTSLTALQCELQVHSLGGGVLVLVPGEAARIRVPRAGEPGASHLERIDELLKAGRPLDAYLAGDDAVLRAGGFSRAEIASIEEGAEILRGWRSSKPSGAA